jgi:UDP-glucuronate 4-epimerase
MNQFKTESQSFVSNEKSFHNRGRRFYRVSSKQKLLKEGFEVWGLDNLNNYYDITLKEDRIRELGVDQIAREGSDNDYLNRSASGNFSFIKGDLADNLLMEKFLPMASLSM